MFVRPAQLLRYGETNFPHRRLGSRIIPISSYVCVTTAFFSFGRTGNVHSLNTCKQSNTHFGTVQFHLNRGQSCLTQMRPAHLSEIAQWMYSQFR